MPGLEPPGAAAALLGRGLRHPHRLEPRHAARRVETRHAHQAAIDDDADAFDGQAGLGDRGRQHHLAPARRRRPERRVLRRLRQIAIERRDDDLRAEPGMRRSRRATRRISAPPGRKTSTLPPPHRARAGSPPRHRPRTARAAGRSRWRISTGKLRPALATTGASPRSRATWLAVERRRHHQQAQILAQMPARIQRQRQAQIGFEAALVELVEDDQADAVERGIVLDQPRQDALGHHLDARFGPMRVSSRGAEAHGLADALSPSISAMRRAAARVASRRGSSIRFGRARARAHRAAPAAPASSCPRRAAPRAPPTPAPASAARSAGRVSPTGSRLDQEARSRGAMAVSIAHRRGAGQSCAGRRWVSPCFPRRLAGLC